jgi:hypothetical protein
MERWPKMEVDIAKTFRQPPATLIFDLQGGLFFPKKYFLSQEKK